MWKLNYLQIMVVGDVTLCSLVHRYQCFGGMCCLCLQVIPVEAAGSSEMFVCITTKLHGVTSQKTVNLILIALRAKNLILIIYRTLFIILNMFQN
jgi:hypothetical protein